jgi:hypothetical protein
MAPTGMGWILPQTRSRKSLGHPPFVFVHNANNASNKVRVSIIPVALLWVEAPK